MATIHVYSDFRVYPGETLSFTNEAAFWIEDHGAPSPSLYIDGEVLMQANSGDHFVIGIGYGWQDGVVHISAGGAVRATLTDPYGELTGYAASSWSPQFINEGVFDIEAASWATGLVTWDAGPWTFRNSGEFTVTSGGFAHGVRLSNAGAVLNSGNIVVSGGTGTQAVIINGFGGELQNSGLIRATDNDPDYLSVAVRWNATFGAGQIFHNSGTIEGEYALIVWPYVSDENLLLFRNSGTMRGIVDLGHGHGELRNEGLVDGFVFLGVGNDVYDGRLGAISGDVYGEDGTDTLLGGAFSDGLFGDFGADSIDGGAGDDWIEGGRDGDWLAGGAGFDLLSYESATMAVQVDLAAGRGFSSGEDTLSGFEWVLGGVFADTIAGSAAAETLFGWDGGDLLNGAGGDDLLFGEAGDDRLTGGSGHDHLFGGHGADTLDGGAGFDYVRYDDQAYAGFIVSLSNPALNTGAAAGDVLIGIEGLVLGTGNDVGYGDGGDNYLYGMAGHDNLYGGAGADYLHGGSGFDYARYDAETSGFTASLAVPAHNTGAAAGDVFVEIEGLILGSGNDWAYGDAGANYLYGMAGHDNLIGGAGADYLHGGAGFDYVRYDAETSGFTVSLAAPARNSGAAAGDVLVEIEGLVLGGGNDVAYGDAGANYLYGMGGADNLFGGAGADYLHGGAGFDYARYDDQAYGGFTASLANPGANTGAAAGDVFAEIEGLVLGSGDDSGAGNGADNYLYGLGGNDTLDGGAGADHLHGGAGGDRFVVSSAAHSSAAAPDRVLDFNPGEGDLIDVSAVDADPGQGGDQAFAFVAAFSGTAGQVRAVVDAGLNQTRLEFDLNGDGAGQEMVILLTGQFATALGLVL
ncbi:calcium-binding protein [Phenylobacterium terrae]|uniref:Calcium-binding protein n=1 Tax=Phenylobacterium terrae TaxID=2665495 RepID=A0ABW4N3L9_9CAUL